MLTDDQKERRMQVRRNIIERLQSEIDLLPWAITADETELLSTTRKPTLPNQKKARQSHVVDHILRYSLQRVSDTGQADHSVSLHGDLTAYASLRGRKETRVAVWQIMAASSR